MTEATTHRPGTWLHTKVTQHAMNSILTRVYELPSGTRALAENILAEQFIELPNGDICLLSLSTGNTTKVCAAPDNMNAALTANPQLLAGELKTEWEQAKGRELNTQERLIAVNPLSTHTYLANYYPALREEAIKTLIYVHTRIRDRLHAMKAPNPCSNQVNSSALAYAKALDSPNDCNA